MALPWKLCVAGGALCLAAALWFAWPGSTDSSLAPARPPSGRPADSRAAELIGTAGAVRAERGAVPTTAVLRPPPDPPIVLEPPVDGGLPLRVVRGRTEEPVAFALVALGEERRLDAVERLTRDAFWYTSRGRFVGALKHYRADAEGRLQVPLPEREAHAFASSPEGDWGWLDLDPSSAGEQLLRVLPDRAFLVRVVSSPDGAPAAGVDVGLRYETWPGDSDLVDVVTTGADGEARFEHLREHLEGYWAHTERLWVVVCGVFADTPAVELDPERLPEAVELVLPACTELVVRLIGADGAPFTEPALVRVAPAGEDAFDDSGRTAAAVVQGGSAVFHQIGPALDLAVIGYTGEAGSAEERAARSATMPGGRAEAVIQLVPVSCVLAGRLMGPDGAPAALRRAGFRIATADGLYDISELLETDASGCFRYPLPSFLMRGSRLLVDLWSDEGGRSSASTAIDGPFEAGEHPLGDLSLALDPLVVSGRVVDSAGQPIAGADVDVAADLDEWRPSAHVRTAADGAFEARGSFGGAPLRVLAEHPGHGSRRLAVGRSALGIEIVLDAAGGLAGSAILSQEWLCDFAQARARREGTEPWLFEASIERPGVFSFSDLQPGAWSVEIRMDGEEEGGVRVDGVQVAAGKTTRDPRLQEVDLRGKARYLTVRVVDEDGASIEYALVYHRRPGSPVWNQSARVENGEAYVFTQLPELELYVAADAFRSAFVPAARDGQEIALAKGVPARLTWAGPPMPSDRTLALTCLLRTALPGLPPLERTPSTEGEVRLPETGAYEVVWSLHESSESGWHEIDSLSEPLVIRDTTAAEAYQLFVPAAFRARVEAAPIR